MVIPQDLNLLKLVRKNGKQVAFVVISATFVLTFGLSSRHPRFPHLVDVIAPEVVHRRIHHASRFGNASSLPYPSAGPLTWLSWDTSANPCLPDNRLAGRQHNPSEIRRPGRDRPGPHQLHPEPIRAYQGSNDNHHGHSDTDSHSPPHSNCNHPYDIALYVLGSRLPKHHSVCIDIRYVHTYPRFILPELWIYGRGLFALVWRGLRAGGTRREGHACAHYHRSSGTDVSSSGRNVSAATAQGGGEYDAEYSHEGWMGRGSGNDNVCHPSGITKSSEERVVSGIEVDEYGSFFVLLSTSWHKHTAFGLIDPFRPPHGACKHLGIFLPLKYHTHITYSFSLNYGQSAPIPPISETAEDVQISNRVYDSAGMCLSVSELRKART
jgi:hypothetical protein